MSLLPVVSSIPVFQSQSLMSLSRINNSIYGYDSFQQLFFEIDTKHSIVWTHSLGQKQTNNLINCKYFDDCLLGNSLRSGYINCYDRIIQKYSFMEGFSIEKKNLTVLTSNILSNFTGVFDAFQNTLICVKFHQNHAKFTLNWVEGSKQKKIIKLIDFNLKSLHINHHNPQILYADEGNQVYCFDLNKPKIDTLLLKKSVILFDKQYIFCTSTNLLSKFNDVYQLECVDLRTGKYAFGFKGNGFPNKIQAFGNWLFYLTKTDFLVYDNRKNQPYAQLSLDTEKSKLSARRFDDFLLEPNLGIIYLSASDQLKALKFTFF